MLVTRIAACAHLFNRFPVIQPVSSKSSPFQHFFAHFGLFWVRPWDNSGKCYMDGKRIQCWSNALQHIPIYLQPFTNYSEILVGYCNLFIPLAFNASVGVFPLEFREKFGSHKTIIMGLPGSEDSLTIGRAVLTQYQRVTDRRNDGRTSSLQL